MNGFPVVVLFGKRLQAVKTNVNGIVSLRDLELEGASVNEAAAHLRANRLTLCVGKHGNPEAINERSRKKLRIERTDLLRLRLEHFEALPPAVVKVNVPYFEPHAVA